MGLIDIILLSGDYGAGRMMTMIKTRQRPMGLGILSAASICLSSNNYVTAHEALSVAQGFSGPNKAVDMETGTEATTEHGSESGGGMTTEAATENNTESSSERTTESTTESSSESGGGFLTGKSSPRPSRALPSGLPPYLNGAPKSDYVKNDSQPSDFVKGDSQPSDYVKSDTQPSDYVQSQAQSSDYAKSSSQPSDYVKSNPTPSDYVSNPPIPTDNGGASSN